MSAEIIYLPHAKQSWCIQRALETYAGHLRLPIDAIPPEEQLAVMYACVEAVRGALADLERGLAS